MLYSQWGAAAGNAFASDGGFEEWKVKIYPVPPKLTQTKTVVNNDGGTAVARDFTLWQRARVPRSASRLVPVRRA